MIAIVLVVTFEGTVNGHSVASAQPTAFVLESPESPNFLLRSPRFGESLSPIPARSPDPEADLALPTHADALEEALRSTYAELDDLILLSVLRSAITGVNQAYCAIDNLVPQGNEISTIDYLVGIGCAAATVALFAISAVTANGLRADDDDRDRLERFRRARQNGLTEHELQEFELELEDATDSSEVERILGTTFGIASIGTAIVATVLAATGVIDTLDGTTLAVGSSLVAAVSFPVLAIESPAEAALRRYRTQRSSR